MNAKLPILVLSLGLVGCSKESGRACSPPLAAWGKPHSFGLVIWNKIALDQAGVTYWNGKPVTENTLDKYLSLMPTMNPVPVTVLETEMGAPCSSLDAIRTKMEQHLNCSHGGSCVEGILDVWNNIPSPPGTPVS